MITATLVNELRQKTSVGMMECKKALTETNGDIDAAITYLRERGIMKSAGMATRGGTEGIIAARLSADGKTGLLIEVNCETDFVSRNDQYVQFVDEIANALAASDAKTLEDSPTPADGRNIKAKVLALGENIRLRKFERFDLADHGAIAQYIHMGGKVGVLLEVSAGSGDTAAKDAFRDLVKDITLHIAAAAPKGLSRDDIAAELVEAEKDIFRVQLANEGKPAEMIEKILLGKLGKFFAESCLLEQGFVKEPDITIKKLVEQVAKDLGDTLEVRRFIRFGLGD